MENDVGSSGRLVDGLTVLAIVLGSLVRVVHFWTLGPFWGDEAALAYNLISRSYAQLTRPLDLLQAAPVGFLMLEKGVGGFLGMEENLLRLLPLVAGIATMILCAWSVRSLWGPGVAAIATSLLACSPELIRYSGELKPYTIDTAVALVLFTRFSRFARDRRWSDLWLLAGAGVMVPWFSLPSVFVLAGCGGCLILRSAVERDWRLVRILTALATLWLGSFAVQYGLCLSATSTEPELVTYWISAFAPFPPESLADLRWYVGKAVYLFEPVVGLGARHLALAVFLAGCALMWSRHRLPVAFLLTTVAAVLAASALRKYPFNGRLILFLMPILIIPIAVVVDRLITHPKWSRCGFGLILLGSFLAQPIRTIGTQLAADIRRPDLHSMNLALYQSMIQNYQSDDRFLISHEAAWSFHYYSLRSGFTPTKPIYLAKGPGSREEFLNQVTRSGHSRTWLLASLARPGNLTSEVDLLTTDLPAAVQIVSRSEAPFLSFSLRCYTRSAD